MSVVVTVPVGLEVKLEADGPALENWSMKTLSLRTFGKSELSEVTAE
jgi:hypothetical protein